MVYCDAFSDEQLISDDSPYTKSQKAIDLAKLKPGADIYLNYVRPKRNEYLSMSSIKDGPWREKMCPGRTTGRRNRRMLRHQRTAEHLAGILKYRAMAVKNIRFRREK